MPYSDYSNEEWVKEKLVEINPATVLDIGPGAGKYSDFIRPLLPDCTIEAVEVWEPYFERFKLREKYDEVFLADVRSWDSFSYDLVIFGDVLEHMTENSALEIWEKCAKQAGVAMISVPIVHWPQGEIDNNPYEVHLTHWDSADIREKFHGITEYRDFDQTGTFIADFRAPQ